MRLSSMRFAFCFILSILIISYASPFVIAQGNREDWSGPYIDKIRFVVAPEMNYDLQYLQLINDEVDLISGAQKGQAVIELRLRDDVEIDMAYRNGFETAFFDCQRWPFNITDFRRAIAYALDKHELIRVWQDLAILQDGCLPRFHPASIEDELEEHFYDKRVDVGATLLDDLGFIDSDDDGWREGPGGVELDTVLLGTVYNPPNMGPLWLDSTNVVTQAFLDLNMSAETVNFPGGFGDQFYAFITGEIDLFFYIGGWANLDLGGWADFWYTGNNYAFWSNGTWDLLAETIYNSPNYDDIIEAAKEMQRIWLDECPGIMINERLYLTSYSVDNFEGFVHHDMMGAQNFLTGLSVRPKNDDDGFGSTLRWAIPQDELYLRPHIGPAGIYDLNWLGGIYPMTFIFDSLVRVAPDGNDMNWLAEDFTIETRQDDPDLPQEMHITIDMVQNAKWSDGTPITAKDVVYSILWYRDNLPYFGRRYVSDIRSCYAKTDHQLVVGFGTESWYNWHTICYLPILPVHMADQFDEIFPVSPLSGDYELTPETIHNGVFSGPFVPTEWVEHEYIELTKNEYYWNLPSMPVTTTTTPTPTTPINFTISLTVGVVSAAIVMTIGAYLVFKKT